MKKFKILLIMIMAITLLTGCEADVYDMPEVLQRPIEMMYLADYGFNYSVIYLDDQQSELAEKCFNSIKLQGLTLALPMNVSDLPEGCTIEEDNGYGAVKRDVYNGYVLSQATVSKDGLPLISVEVLHKKGEDINDGQITSMYFYSLGGMPELGEGVITKETSSSMVWECFGAPETKETSDEKYGGCYYVLEDGRIIFVEYSIYGEYPPSQLYLIMDTGIGW